MRLTKHILFVGILFLFNSFLFAQESNEENEVASTMEELVNHSVPGIVFAIKSTDLDWAGAAGFSSIEEQNDMEVKSLHYLQSISKIYTAVAVLQLVDQSKIDLDESIATYLPVEVSSLVEQIDQMTVRMVLNHTSGIPEYNYLPEYVTILLQDQDYAFSALEYIQFLKGEQPDFPPGSRYSYRNSGYVLLTLMLDHLVGDHARFIQEGILDPLDLKETFYRNTSGYLDNPLLPNSYWDRYGNGYVENVTHLQKQNVRYMVGDDGLITSAKDGITFLHGLLEGELLSSKMLEEMKIWTLDSEGNPAYGLGLDITEIAGEEAWGHSGGGLGSGSQLYYFPKFEAYIFAAINLGTVTGSVIHTKAEPIIEKLYKKAFEMLETSK